MVDDIDIDIDNATGRRLRAIRAGRGLSLRVASGLAGMSKSQLARYESGQDRLDRRSKLSRLADAYGVDITELTGQPFLPSAPGPDARAHGSVESVREALRRIELEDLPEPGPIDAIDDRVRAAREASLRCDLDGLGATLPDLAMRTSAAARAGSARAGELLVPTMRMTFQLVKDLGFHDVAWQAVGYAHRAAAAHGDPAWIALTEFDRARAMIGANAPDAALSLVGRAAGELRRPRGPTAEAYGMLLLAAALQNAILGRASEVPALLDDAERVAAHTGDGSFGDMHFGPTNLQVWRITMAVETGDLGRVPELASRVDASAIPSRDRQAMFHLDVARGLSLLHGRQGAAVWALSRGESRAPQLMHANFHARQTVLSLRSRLPSGTRAGDEVRALARRMRLPA